MRWTGSSTIVNTFRRSGTREQGETCLAWAATAAHQYAAAQRHQYAAAKHLSVEYLHWACGHAPHRRGTIGGLRNALPHHGQPADDQWPYDPTADESDPSYQPPITVTGPYHTANLRNGPQDPVDLATELMAGHLAVAVLRVTPQFLNPTGGIIHGTHGGTDGHAVTVVGVARTTRAVGPLPKDEHLLCLRNSWGASWGIDGHALLADATWRACGLRTAIVDPAGLRP